MKTPSVKSVLRAALAGGLLSLAIGSCGRAAEEEPLQIDSNTNWLVRCESDAQCSGSLRCYCGQCTQPCASTDECGLLDGAECAPTASGVCSDIAPVGGLCVLGCREDAECGSDFSCIDSRCVPDPCSPEFIRRDSLMRALVADLSTLDSPDRRFVRYVSLANHSVNRACDGTLAREQQALAKLLNSLSLSTTVSRPERVDAAGLLYRFNLLDYEWDRPVEVQGSFFADVWEALVARNPLAVPLMGSDADVAALDTGTRVPVMFADSLIAAGTQPELYAAILGIPPEYDTLLDDLGIDRFEPLLTKSRAGFINRDELIATRWDLTTRSGYLWEIATLGVLNASLLDNPLRVPAGERAVIFTLPNGLQAFAYVNAGGSWIPESPTFLDVATSSFRARAPLTLLREHSPRVSVRDDVTAHVLGAPESYTPEVRDAILTEYMTAAELAARVAEDADRFVVSALISAGVTIRSPEPISATVDAYDADVTLPEAAGALLMSPEDLRRDLVLLPPAFAVLDGGAMDRDDFDEFFAQAACVFGVIDDNAPAPDICELL